MTKSQYNLFEKSQHLELIKLSEDTTLDKNLFTASFTLSNRININIPDININLTSLYPFEISYCLTSLRETGT